MCLDSGGVRYSFTPHSLLTLLPPNQPTRRRRRRQFPDNAASYPTEPFRLRVVYPRCVQYSGHVTVGGSICIEALTLSGGPGGWQPSYCVESIMNVSGL
jgi:hypothetical protein